MIHVCYPGKHNSTQVLQINKQESRVENIVIGIRNVLDLTVYLISPQITKKVHVTLQYMNTEETPRIFPCPLASVDDYILENNKNMI